jgi:hypothetical protein
MSEQVEPKKRKFIPPTNISPMKPLQKIVIYFNINQKTSALKTTLSINSANIVIDSNTESQFVSLDSSMNYLLKPLMEEQKMKFENSSPNKGKLIVDVLGRNCTKDFVETKKINNQILEFKGVTKALVTKLYWVNDTPHNDEDLIAEHGIKMFADYWLKKKSCQIFSNDLFANVAIKDCKLFPFVEPLFPISRPLVTRNLCPVNNFLNKKIGKNLPPPPKWMKFPLIFQNMWNNLLKKNNLKKFCWLTKQLLKKK